MWWWHNGPRCNNDKLNLPTPSCILGTLEGYAARLTLGAHIPPQGSWGFSENVAQRAMKQQYYSRGNHVLGVGSHTCTHISLDANNHQWSLTVSRQNTQWARRKCFQCFHPTVGRMAVKPLIMCDTPWGPPSIKPSCNLLTILS